MAYPQIRATLSPNLALALPALSKTPIRATLSTKLSHPGHLLISHLSFSQFEDLLQIEDPHKRLFYEAECIKGGWSVRELRRQIGSLYYERTALSKNKKKLSGLTHLKTETTTTQSVIRDPYVFEFLGLKSKEVARESQVEDSLLDKLQDFLLELGKGFCFEARKNVSRLAVNIFLSISFFTIGY
jgi:predicted nuclease of restriction endonuclease-like (RecB) superfamily